MKITIEFSTDNAAFQDFGFDFQVSRILIDVVKNIEAGDEEGNIKDINGNSIGEFKVLMDSSDVENYEKSKQ